MLGNWDAIRNYAPFVGMEARTLSALALGAVSRNPSWRGAWRSKKMRPPEFGLDPAQDLVATIPFFFFDHRGGGGARGDGKKA